MSQCYSVIIYWGISAPGHGKEVVDRLNAVDKRYTYQLVSNVQLPGSNIFDYQMKMITRNQNNDVNLAKELQKHPTKEHCKYGVIDQVKYKKIHWNKIDRQTVSCSGYCCCCIKICENVLYHKSISSITFWWSTFLTLWRKGFE